MNSGDYLYNILCTKIKNRIVLDVVRKVPRENFIAKKVEHFAFYDKPISIGYNQTTSSPFIITRMIEILIYDKKLPLNILEIGCGCGYQTALLAEMGCAVTGIERIKSLADSCRQKLHSMNYNNVSIIHGDGALGFKKKSPYDGIIICAECNKIPAMLCSQLKKKAI